MQVINYLIRTTKEFTIIFENNPVLLHDLLKIGFLSLLCFSKKNDMNYLNVKYKSQE